MCFDPEEYYDNDVTLYYDKELNRMIDDGGFEVTNIYSIISPNMLFLFKNRKEDMFVYGVDGQAVELIYPHEEADDLDYN